MKSNSFIIETPPTYKCMIDVYRDGKHQNTCRTPGMHRNNSTTVKSLLPLFKILHDYLCRRKSSEYFENFAVYIKV